MAPGTTGNTGNTGKVKWFNNAKGYGFILAHTGGEDLFVHYSSIQMDGYKTLKAGQSVEYDIQQGPKGLHAVNIRFDPNSALDITDAPKAEAEIEDPAPVDRASRVQQGVATESSR